MPRFTLKFRSIEVGTDEPMNQTLLDDKELPQEALEWLEVESVKDVEYTNVCCAFQRVIYDSDNHYNADPAGLEGIENISVIKIINQELDNGEAYYSYIGYLEHSEGDNQPVYIRSSEVPYISNYMEIEELNYEYPVIINNMTIFTKI